VKTRQFKQLGGMALMQRLPLLVQGLEAVAANVRRIAAERVVCAEAGAHHAAELLRNLGREEAGKFLVLLDTCRAPASAPATISRQFDRARIHLAKLIYAQIADYSIASQRELLRAVDMHRQRLYLAGPNDFDWIFPNELIAEREGALYVDLVDSEGELGWSNPPEDAGPLDLPKSIQLVGALSETGIVSTSGLLLLQDAWRGFDPHTETHYGEWAKRSRATFKALTAEVTVTGHRTEAARLAIELWPMPMVEFDLTMVEVSPEEMAKRREALSLDATSGL
jgi:AbiV family abortive infection protein